MTSLAEHTATETTQQPISLFIPSGLIGFPEFKDVELIEHEDAWPFITLRSAVDGLQFLAIEPNNVVPDYVVRMSDFDSSYLRLTRTEDARILNIVTVHSADPQFVTVNLIGPIVINRNTRVARQIIVENSDHYSARHVLVDERA